MNNSFNRNDSSYYLFNACENGNEAAVNFLLKHGVDIAIKGKNNNITLVKMEYYYFHVFVDMKARLIYTHADVYRSYNCACRGESAQWGIYEYF